MGPSQLFDMGYDITQMCCYFIIFLGIPLKETWRATLLWNGTHVKFFKKKKVELLEFKASAKYNGSHGPPPLKICSAHSIKWVPGYTP